MPENKDRAKILIVDDNKQNLDLLMDLFRENYKIVASLTPERALKIALSDSPPDIILLDIMMPGMDGYEVCSILKNSNATKNIPIIFITAVSEVMDAARGFDLGAADYITKPFFAPIVKARVEMQLNLARKYKMLERYAFIDALTEIPNRRRFDEVLEREWKRTSRSSRPISLILMDIDHFKQYNDHYGHGKGDEALKRIAQEVHYALRRSGDFLARYGGEEFVAVMPYTDEEKALATGRHIIDLVKGLAIEHKKSPCDEHLTVSVGAVTVIPGAGAEGDFSIQQVLEEVDRAMYEAKKRGKKCMVNKVL